MTQGEYAGGMKLVKWSHLMEKRIYPLAAWVSHTNQQRMELFEKDVQPVIIANKRIVPNYPPFSWKQEAANAKKDNTATRIKKIVYTGAVSMETMYIADFAEWVIQQEGKVSWDIYSLNIEPAAIDYLINLKSEYIQVKPGVYYYELPALLGKYDAGVILYKGHIPNWIYNVPNKLFEYHVCGLDTWFPQQMVTSLPYVTHGTYPVIMALDFSKLKLMNYKDLLNRTERSFKQLDFSCEAALHDFSESLKN
ncbi:MAG: hypothetical protein NVSMB7_15920 [Chitinophagaceae bacterium]